MIILYKGLFNFLYKLLEFIGDDFENPTAESRAFAIVLILSIFQWMNVISVVKDVEASVAWVPYSIICAINYVIFLRSDNFKTIVTKPTSPWIKMFSIVYFILTFVVFHFARSTR